MMQVSRPSTPSNRELWVIATVGLLVITLGFVQYLHRYGWEEFIATFDQIGGLMLGGLVGGGLIGFLMYRLHRRSEAGFRALSTVLYAFIGVNAWRQGSYIWAGIMAVVTAFTVWKVIKAYGQHHAAPSP